MDLTKRAQDAVVSIAAHLKYMHDHKAIVVERAKELAGLESFEEALSEAGISEEVHALRKEGEE